MFETGASLLLPSAAPTRYAVRQVLDQELRKTNLEREALARQARFQAGSTSGRLESLVQAAANAKDIKKIVEEQKDASSVKRDFFGRIIEARPVVETGGEGTEPRGRKTEKERKVWVTYHEGLNNAVRKPMSLQEFMRGL